MTTQSFKSLGEMATRQRQEYNDAPRHKLLKSIENALLGRQLPELAEITIPIDVNDALLYELFNNRELMKELKVYLVCKKCNDGVRPIRQEANFFYGKNEDRHRIVRLCKECKECS